MLYFQVLILKRASDICTDLVGCAIAKSEMLHKNIAANIVKIQTEL